MDHIKASKPTVGTCGEAKTVYQANECCAGSAGKQSPHAVNDEIAFEI